MKLFWTSVKNTVVLLVMSVPPTMILSLAGAMLFASATRSVVRSFFRAVYFLPVITSSVAVAFVWSWLYDPQNGLINEILRLIGMGPQRWLFDLKLVLPSLAAMNIWSRLGFDMIIFIAGLQSIPQEFYEAAMIDGASRAARFRYITLPLLNPQIVLVMIFEVINALKIFDLPYVATQGGPANASRVAVFHIYDLALWKGQPTSGFTTTLGVLALLLGSLQLARPFLHLSFELPVFAVLLMVLGLIVLAGELKGSKDH